MSEEKQRQQREKVRRAFWSKVNTVPTLVRLAKRFRGEILDGKWDDVDFLTHAADLLEAFGGTEETKEKHAKMMRILEERVKEQQQEASEETRSEGGAEPLAEQAETQEGAEEEQVEEEEAVEEEEPVEEEEAVDEEEPVEEEEEPVDEEPQEKVRKKRKHVATEVDLTNVVEGKRHRGRSQETVPAQQVTPVKQPVDDMRSALRDILEEMSSLRKRVEAIESNPKQIEAIEEPESQNLAAWVPAVARKAFVQDQEAGPSSTVGVTGPNGLYVSVKRWVDRHVGAGARVLLWVHSRNMKNVYLRLLVMKDQRILTFAHSRHEYHSEGEYTVLDDQGRMPSNLFRFKMHGEISVFLQERAALFDSGKEQVILEYLQEMARTCHT